MNPPHRLQSELQISPRSAPRVFRNTANDSAALGLNWLVRYLPQLLILFCGTACMPRVQLSPPAATAPVEDRQRAYEQLKLSTVGSVRTEANSTNFVLANGVQIFHPADLLPVVVEPSVTHSELLLWERNRRQGLGLLGGFLGGLVVGTGFFMTSIAKGLSRPWLISSLVTLGASFVLAAIGIRKMALAQMHRLRVYHTYEENLQQRLRLEPVKQRESEMRDMRATESPSSATDGVVVVAKDVDGLIVGESENAVRITDTPAPGPQ